MRLWSIHPAYLDSRGLVALWREGLLGLAVLQGNTKGYRAHPQLARFRGERNPVLAIRRYLWYVYREAETRGYRFDRTKIGKANEGPRMKVTRGQLRYELDHLRAKLRIRNPDLYESIKGLKDPRPHPLFEGVAGKIEAWERGVNR
jgi:hypothetical protein